MRLPIGRSSTQSPYYFLPCIFKCYLHRVTKSLYLQKYRSLILYTYINEIFVKIETNYTEHYNFKIIDSFNSTDTRNLLFLRKQKKSRVKLKSYSSRINRMVQKFSIHILWKYYRKRRIQKTVISE